MQDSLSLPNNISKRDDVLRIGIFYFVSVAGPALLLSLFTLLYAPVGLVRNTGAKLVHFGQLMVALVTLPSLAVGGFVASVTFLNPG